MPFTGADFKNLLDIKTDMAYTGYFSNPQVNTIVREATTKAVEVKVATNDRIQVQDDLFGIFKTNATYTPSSNTVSLIIGGSGISDYHHTMNVKAKFIDPLRNNYVAVATNTSPIRITTNRHCNLRTGEQVLIAGVTGNTNANGTRYVKRLKNDLFELYQDINLLVPITGNGSYTGSVGQISRVVYNTAYDMKSNRKFSTLDEPTIYNPYYEIADTVLKVYPLTNPCSEVTIDYVSTPAYIDVTDNVDDLLEVYSQRFIDFICDETARLMFMYIVSMQQYQNESMEQTKP